MKRIILIFFTSFVFLFLFSGITYASQCPGFEDSLVSCGQFINCRCELGDIFIMIVKIYIFLVFYIATPLAGLLIVIGGILLLVSAGNPGLANRAKHIITWSVIAWLLIFGSWLIINFVLITIGYPGQWWSF